MNTTTAATTYVVRDGPGAQAIYYFGTDLVAARAAYAALAARSRRASIGRADACRDCGTAIVTLDRCDPCADRHYGSR